MKWSISATVTAVKATQINHPLCVLSQLLVISQETGNLILNASNSVNKMSIPSAAFAHYSLQCHVLCSSLYLFLVKTPIFKQSSCVIFLRFITSTKSQPDVPVPENNLADVSVKVEDLASTQPTDVPQQAVEEHIHSGANLKDVAKTPGAIHYATPTVKSSDAIYTSAF